MEWSGVSAEPGRTFRLGVPIGLCIGLLLFLFIALTPDDFFTMIGLIVAYLIAPAGKETVIPLGVVLGIPWWLVAGTMALFDIIGALFIVWNFDLALHIPFLGRWIARFMEGGRDFFTRRPWLGHLYFLGLVLFVMFPLEGSGGVSGAILGRIMGMKSRRVMGAVVLGATVSCFAIALGTDYVVAALQLDLVKGLCAVIIIFLLVCVAGVIRHVMRRQKSQEQ